MAQPGDYQRGDEEWQAALRRVLGLAPADQLRVYAALTDNLGGALGQETERERQARLRGEALEAMQAAAQHLGLPDGQAPNVSEYKQAARETDLPMSFNAAYEAFERRWESAMAFFRGERVPLSAAQRAANRRALGRMRGRLDPVECLRRFLAQEPPPASTTLADYQGWAKEHNEQSSEQDRVLENANNVRLALHVSWQDALAVARREKGLEGAQRAHLAERLNEAGPLVGHHLAAALLGKTPSVLTKQRTRTGFPRPVVELGAGSAWLRTEIEEWGGGRRDFGTKDFALQEDFLNSAELSERLGRPHERIRNNVGDERWDLVPRPTGKAARRLFWERRAVERWEAERS